MGGFRGLPFLLPLAFAAGAALAEPEQASPSNARGDIQDIRGFMPMDGPPPFALTGGLLLLVGGLLLVRRRAMTGVSPPPPPLAEPEDPLARLLADHRNGRCPGDLLIIRLDGLVRDALSARSGIPAHRLTSAELRRSLWDRVSTEERRAPLDGFLNLADRVKFAAHVPATAEIEAAVLVATRLLEAVPEGPAA